MGREILAPGNYREESRHKILGKEKHLMNMKKLVYQLKPPCPKCPYTLGLVHTLVNPCPQCKANGYQTFERFQKRLPEGSDNAEN